MTGEQLKTLSRAESAAEHVLQQALYELLPDAVYLLDEAGKVQACRAASPATPSTAGPGERFWERLPDEAAAALRAAVTTALQSRLPQVVEYQDSAADATRHYEARLAARAPGQVLLVNRDITARKRLENDLRRRGRQFDDALQNARNVLYCFNVVQDRYEYISPFVETMTGHTVDELRQFGYAAVIDAIHPEDWPRCWEAIEAARAASADGRAPVTLEYRRRRKDGSYLWVRDYSTGFFDDDGNLLRVVGAAYDISSMKEAELALLQTQRRFNEALRHAHGVMYVYNAAIDGYEYLSPHLAEMTGYSHEILCRMTRAQILEHLHPEDGPNCLAQIATAGQAQRGSRAQLTLEYRRRHRDGHYFWIRDYMTVFFDDAGAMTRIVGTAYDVTERKATEAALQQSEQRLELALQGAELAVWDYDIERDHWTGSPEFYHLLGYQLGEITAAMLANRGLIHPDDRAAVRARMESHLRGEHPICESEYRLRCRDGQYRWVLDRAKVVSRDGQGNPTRVSGTIMDIHARKEAERQVRMFKTMIEQTKEGIGLLDAEGRVVFVNDALAAMFGVPAADLLGKTFTWPLAPHEIPRMQEVFAQVMRQGRWSGEVWYRRRDGSTFPALVGATVLHAATGEPLMLMGAFQDLTELKLAQDLLSQHQRQLAHLARLSTVGEMATGLAHELNQPLCAINTYVSGCRGMLLSGTPNLSEVRDALADVARQAERASEIVRRIRGFTRRQEAPRKVIDIRTIVGDALGLVAHELRQKQMPVTRRLSREPLETCCDPLQIEQVLLNLILNAVEAMEEARVSRPQLRLLAARKNGVIEVGVADAGPGLDPEQLEQVLQPFYTSKPSGLGMGLSISRTIVEDHGGRLWATRNRQGGTTFRFTLPIAHECDKNEVSGPVGP